ncbi:kinase [Thraustotheca clavata]|uniref:Kinase n=1 Tax=Thraustotheca clavata TaxID=74557 RepID=A0A1W0A4L9_9STRA|nr:kinase [Thraustotheca clavata]
MGESKDGDSLVLRNISTNAILSIILNDTNGYANEIILTALSTPLPIPTANTTSVPKTITTLTPSETHESNTEPSIDPGALALAIFCPLCALGMCVYLLILYRSRYQAKTTLHREIIEDSSIRDRSPVDTIPTIYHEQLRRGRFLAPPSENFEVSLGSYFAGNGTMQVVIKRLTPRRQTDAEYVILYLDHINLLARLRHPNLVGIVGIARPNQPTIELAMEYMNEGLIRDRLLSSNPLTLSWQSHKLSFATDVIDALAYLHHHAILHMQLSANAILLTSTPQRTVAKLSNIAIQGDSVKVINTSSLELSSRFSNAISSIRRSASCLSSHSSMATSVNLSKWLAPEILRGEQATSASDIYSFGVFLSVLDTQEDPYVHHVDMEDQLILQRISNGALRPTLSVLCPPSIADLALSCLNSNPADRPQASIIATYLRQPNITAMSCSESINPISSNIHHTYNSV